MAYEKIGLGSMLTNLSLRRATETDLSEIVRLLAEDE